MALIVLDTIRLLNGGHRSHKKWAKTAASTKKHLTGEATKGNVVQAEVYKAR
jgi:hypothetical protein